MVRCIPVMIADDIECPYENEIDYSENSLKIRENDVDNIVEILRSFSEEERTKKLEAIDGVWMMFTYQRPPQPGDAFHTVMRKRIEEIRTWT